MPIYEYFCDDCKQPFQVFVRSMSAQVDAACPTCGGKHAEKQVTAPSTLGMGGERAALGSAAAACAPSG